MKCFYCGRGLSAKYRLTRGMALLVSIVYGKHSDICEPCWVRIVTAN